MAEKLSKTKRDRNKTLQLLFEERVNVFLLGSPGRSVLDLDEREVRNEAMIIRYTRDSIPAKDFSFSKTLREF